MQSTLNAQYSDVPQDDKYGLDPLLYNGVYYTYFIPKGTLSHPCFQSPDYLMGSAVLRGKFYPSLSLKYDLLNQQVVLQYKVENGGVKHIILSDAWLESFNLGDSHFEISAVIDSINQICQVIGSGSIRIFYHWTKELKLDMRPGAHNYFFTPALRKAFVVTDKGASKFTGNKNLLSLLDPKIQARAKKYLSQKKINVKKASDNTISAFLDFINAPPKK
ncbi:MAG: hypothetical protein ABJC12_02170 [Saprospiraceae bacterium]